MVLVCGAGAIGSLIAYRLKKAGKEIEILARGNRLEEIRVKGITVSKRMGFKRNSVRVNTCERFQGNVYYDFILIVVPNQSVEQVIESMPDNMQFGKILFIGNHVMPEMTEKKVLRKFGGKTKVLFGLLNAVAELKAGVDTYLSASTIPLFVTDTGDNKNVKDLLAGSGIKPVFKRNMPGILKTHGALVLPFAYVCYGFDGNLKQVPGYFSNRVITAIAEGLELVEQSGFQTEPGWIKRLIKHKRILSVIIPIVFHTPLADIMITEHAKRCVSEITYMSKVFDIMIRQSRNDYPAWIELRDLNPNRME
ncbi:MAG: hypothetical protein LUE65_04305 [Clostridiales bacterium]|nr:hypothetical protein [Clostridiales bacterium]